MSWFRKVIERLAKGSTALTWRMGRGIVEWLKAGEKISDFLIRLAFLAIPVGIGWSLLAATRLIMWVFVVVWCIAAWRAAATQEPAAPSPQGPPEPAEAEEPERDNDSPKVFKVLRESADPHAHLAVIAEKLGTDTAHVREVLTRAGVPISDVRMRGRGVSTGVKGSDIPSPPPASSPSAEPSEPVVGPGQSDNNNTELTLTRLPSGGQVLSVPDPTNPARTHVKVIGPIES
ncbi:hypothetical protein [Streptomyces sp. NPDC051452]|uniref:hypothetical protein n=1 Tax=Streptomyces sp. NPDC051452 TaxID=3365654 RepID=UPI0037ACD246